MHEYGISTTIDEKDPRQEKWKEQRQERGFDDTEIWNLDITIAKFIYPRLKILKEDKDGYPGSCDSMEEWNQALDDMIFAFESIANSDFPWAYSIQQEDHRKRVDLGLDNFRKYYFNLWT